MLDLKNCTILLVDDTEENIDVLLGNLEDKYQLSVAMDGKTALEIASENIPDLILLDIMMPEMDGYEVIQRLKSDPKTKNIPVIFLTAKTQSEEIVEGLKQGAVDYISKPFNADELLLRVKNHLKLKKYRDLIEEERKRLKVRNYQMEKEIEMAKNIQSAMIPDKSPDNMAFFYKPMEAVGGDFFDIIEWKEEGKIGVFVSDVSGHGVPAAFVTSMIKSFLIQVKKKAKDPAAFLLYLNKMLYNQTAGNFLTAFYGILDLNTRQMVYANAGHNAPYLLNLLMVEQLTPPKRALPIGVYPNEFLKENGKLYQNYTINLEKNTKILIYTDGLTEASPVGNNEEKEFGTEIEPILSQFYKESPEVFLERIYNHLQVFRKSDIFEDDICMVAIDVK